MPWKKTSIKVTQKVSLTFNVVETFLKTFNVINKHIHGTRLLDMQSYMHGNGKKRLSAHQLSQNKFLETLNVMKKVVPDTRCHGKSF